MNYLELAGKKYPIQFGYGALMEYEAATGKSAVSIAEGAANIGFTEVFTLIACGLTNGAEASGEPHTYTPKETALLFDDTKDSAAAIQQAMLFLQQSFATVEQKKTVKMQPTAKRKAG